MAFAPLTGVFRFSPTLQLPVSPTPLTHNLINGLLPDADFIVRVLIPKFALISIRGKKRPRSRDPV